MLYEVITTGTADTEAAEFKKIYDLDVVIIPTHKNMIRIDFPDVIYKNIPAKYRAVIREIKALHEKGQPVLVGTISIDVSEKISNMLKKEGIRHSVLNAKHHRNNFVQHTLDEVIRVRVMAVVKSDAYSSYVKCMRIIVITSYSIHYTKLYESAAVAHGWRQP